MTSNGSGFIGVQIDNLGQFGRISLLLFSLNVERTRVFSLANLLAVSQGRLGEKEKCLKNGNRSLCFKIIIGRWERVRD